MNQAVFSGIMLLHALAILEKYGLVHKTKLYVVTVSHTVEVIHR